jgi:hypothetical protein
MFVGLIEKRAFEELPAFNKSVDPDQLFCVQ